MKKYFLENKLLLSCAILMGAFSAVASAFVSILLQRIIDIAMTKDITGFMSVLLFCAIYMVVLSIISYVASLTIKRLLRNITISLRNDVFQGVMKRSPMTFYKENTADYISALTNDVKMIEENFIIPLLTVFDLFFMFGATLAILLYLSPLITLFLAVGMLLMFLVPALLGKALGQRQDKVSKQLSIFTSKIKDLFSGYEVIRNFSIMPFTRNLYATENKKTADIKFKADKLLALNESLSETLSLLTMVIVIFLGAYLVLVDSITVGTLVALVQLSGTFLTPIILFMQMLPKIKGISPVVQRLKEFSDYEDTSFTGEKEPSFQQSITVKNLSFAYQENNMAIKNLCFTFEKGKKYALVGKSGCGKSTFIKEITAFSSNYQGEIYYDNQELHNIDIEKLNGLVSVIHQNIYMFDSSIKENISLYRDFPSAEWSDALSLSGVKDFLNDVDKTLDSPVGENGSNLSGGQRQRIAVARALIQKTPILILDEGTSSIDMQTAMEIESTLLAKKDLTLITITHSMNQELLKKYDEIIFMQEGHITMTGTIEKLLENREFALFFGKKESAFDNL